MVTRSIAATKSSSSLFLLLLVSSFVVVVDASTTTMMLRRRQKEKDNKEVAETRIVGGDDAGINEFPFFARVDHTDRIWCGGTLIRPDVVLTAAHCEADANVISAVIHAYSSTTYSDNSHHHIPVNVDERVSHPDFERSTMAYDVALLKLSEPILSVDVVKLNDDDANPIVGDELTTIGMGLTESGGTQPASVLQKVNVNVIPLDVCQAMYPQYPVMDDVMLCAMVSGGGKDSCRGDSGGPILDAAGVQVGIVSWGLGCGDEDQPGVYTRISGVKSWIDETLCQLSDYTNDTCEGSLVPSQPPSTVPSAQPSPATMLPSSGPAKSHESSLSIAPSAVPSSFLSMVPSSETSLLPTTLMGDCQDGDGDFALRSGKMQSCKWLAKAPSITRVFLCGMNHEVQEICRKTCGCAGPHS